MTWAQNPKTTVFFGKYYQDKDGQVLSPIEWNVLDEKDGKTLLITTKAIDSKSFHQKRKAVTWDRCDLHQWLNGAFLQTAFTAREQAAIALTGVSALKKPIRCRQSAQCHMSRLGENVKIFQLLCIGYQNIYS